MTRLAIIKKDFKEPLAVSSESCLKVKIEVNNDTDNDWPNEPRYLKVINDLNILESDKIEFKKEGFKKSF